MAVLVRAGWSSDMLCASQQIMLLYKTLCDSPAEKYNVVSLKVCLAAVTRCEGHSWMYYIQLIHNTPFGRGREFVFIMLSK